MTTLLKGMGLLVGGLLFGLVVDYVGYSLLVDIVCVPSHPNTCFVTQHAAFRPLVYGFLWCVPVATAVTFTLFLSSGKTQRASHIFLVLLVGAILALMLIDRFATSPV